MQTSSLTLGNIATHTHRQHAYAAALGPQLMGLRDDRSVANSERHHSRRSSDSLASSDLSVLLSPTAATSAVAVARPASSNESSHRGSCRRRRSKPNAFAA